MRRVTSPERGLSHTVRERSRGRKGAFADYRGEGETCLARGRDGWPVGSIYGRRVMQRRGGTDGFQDLAERIKAPPSRQFVSSDFALTAFFYGEHREIRRNS